MKKIGIILAGAVFLIGCAEKTKSWQLNKVVQLDGVNPIGIAYTDEGLWLSDGDHNRLVLVDTNGVTLQTIDDLERPMHLDAFENTLFVPQYGNDIISVIDSKGNFPLQLSDSLDAPAGVSVFEQEKAVADFYNHRILYDNGAEWISFGKEGKAEGDFYYPTDVQITEDAIWIADAYNNRIQVFDKQGNFLKIIGADQKMNAATGIYVSDDEVFITDFENDRILIFDHDGILKQTLSEDIAKPTDMLVVEDKLYITNYRNGQLTVFELKASKEED